MPEDPPAGQPDGTSGMRGSSPRGDRLVVRRDAHRELEFRYDREERLSRGTAPRAIPSAVSLLRSRPRRLLMLNVLLLVVVALVALRLMTGSTDRARIGPFAARLQALPYGSTVYLTVSLRQAGRQGAASPAGRFTVRFLLEPGGAEVLKTAALPGAPGEEVTVGEALPLEGATRVRAELQVGVEQRTLSRELSR